MRPKAMLVNLSFTWVGYTTIEIEFYFDNSLIMTGVRDKKWPASSVKRSDGHNSIW